MSSCVARQNWHGDRPSRTGASTCAAGGFLRQPTRRRLARRLRCAARAGAPHGPRAPTATPPQRAVDRWNTIQRNRTGNDHPTSRQQ
eukprot:9475953-Pyramimonas_sp.AAC.1